MMQNRWSPIAALGAALCGFAISSPGLAQVVQGTARALDGDSLVVGVQEVRLFGIDAPEFDQTCQKDSASWACGQIARDQLAALVAGQRVECRGQGKDPYGRIVAVCSIGYDELNRTMVEQGWAVAYRQFSDNYVSAELQAKAQRLGIWSSEFVMPHDFRMAKTMRETPSASQPRTQPIRQSYRSANGCLIKGNRNRRGQWIYHLPGMPYYNQTRAEDIFCTEAEAQAAGYRRAIVKP